MPILSYPTNHGFVWASGIPFEGKVSLADRRFVKEAIRTGTFSSGEYTVGRIYKQRPVMNFGYPVKNTTGEVIGVIGVILDLDYAQRAFEKIGLPTGASFSILDHQGIILIRNLKDPFSEKLVGKHDAREDLFTAMTAGADEGTYEAMGNDNRTRLVAYKKISLPTESKPYLYIRSSIPMASATSKAYTSMFEKLGLLVLLFGTGVLLVWFIGKRVIVTPIMLLKKASEQLGSGAATVNVSHVVRGGELGELARSFDDMADALVQNQTALRESEERWATTLASIGDAVIAADIDGTIRFMNLVAEQLTGWTLNEAVKKPVSNVFRIINEHTRNEVESPVAKVFREGMIVGLANHTILVRKDGTEVPIDDSGAPIKDKDGTTVGVVLVFRDITERKRAEEVLRDSELKASTMLNAADESIWLFSLDGSILAANATAAERMGITGDELVGKKWFDLMPPDLVESRQRRIEEVVNAGAPVRFEDTRAGIIFDHSFYPVRDTKGKIIAVANFARDITERKKKEEELYRLNRTLKALSDSDQAMMRAASEIEYLNSVCRIIVEDCGHSMVWIGFAEDDKDKTVRPVVCSGFEEGYLETLNITWADADRGRGPTGIAIRTGKPSMCRNMFTDPLYESWREDALKRGYSSSVALPLMASGKTLGALNIYSKEKDPFSGDEMNLLAKLADDVAYGLTAIRLNNDKARAEEDLRKAHDELELRVQERTFQLSEAYEALQHELEERKKMEAHLIQIQKMEAMGTLAGGIAHDFNNVLAGIIGFAEMVQEDLAPNSQEHKRLGLVLKGAHRGRDLVRQILTFSRAAEQDKKPVSLGHVVQEGLKLLRPTLPTTIEIITTSFTKDDVIYADLAQMHQVLLNLCTNAAHAMGQNGGVLEISGTNTIFAEGDPVPFHDMTPGEYVVLTVSDTGHGMTPEIMERIFDPFFTTKEQGEGTGLGLSVIHGIVKSNGGFIGVESEPGKGSTISHLFAQTWKRGSKPRRQTRSSCCTGKGAYSFCRR